MKFAETLLMLNTPEHVSMKVLKYTINIHLCVYEVVYMRSFCENKCGPIVDFLFLFKRSTIGGTIIKTKCKPYVLYSVQQLVT